MQKKNWRNLVAERRGWGGEGVEIQDSFGEEESGGHVTGIRRTEGKKGQMLSREKGPGA